MKDYLSIGFKLVSLIITVLEQTRLLKRKDPIRIEAERANEIEEIMRVMLGQLGADRIFVVQFHNGGHFYTGASMQKYSLVYESLVPGIQSLRSGYQNLQVTELRSIIRDCIDLGYSFCSPASAYRDNSVVSKMNAIGVQAFVTVPVYNLRGYFIGLVCVDYIKAPHVITVPEKEIVRNFAGQLSGYLTPAIR